MSRVRKTAANLPPTKAKTQPKIVESAVASKVFPGMGLEELTGLARAAQECGDRGMSNQAIASTMNLSLGEVDELAKVAAALA